MARRNAVPIAAAAATLVLGLAFAASSPWRDGTGLPMDDAYIHLDFARNIAHGEIAFNRGELAAGTTSLGWDALLAPAFWLGGNAVAWALALSLLCHALAAFAFARLAARALAETRLPPWTAAAAAALFILSGPLLWYASSGMETSLFLAAGLLSLDAYARGRRTAAALWCGLAVLMRVDAMALAAVLAASALLEARNAGAPRDRAPGAWPAAARRESSERRPPLGAPGVRAAVALVAIPTAFYLPALVANLAIERSPFPATLQGRVMLQTLSFTAFDPRRLPEHVAWWIQYVGRWIDGESFGHLIRGPGVLAAAVLRGLLPVRAFMLAGLVMLVFMRRRRPIGLLLAWAGLAVVAYGCVLPGVAYAGRYEPMLVPLLCLSAAVAAGGLATVAGEKLAPAAARGVLAALLVLFTAHALLEAGVWWDVRRFAAEHIGRVHVAMGRFVRSLPSDRAVAAFDVGAIKYLNPDRTIVDWAGLTDGGMRLAIREGRGASYLRSKYVGYLAAMEGADGTLHRYPFDLAVESQAGRMAFTKKTDNGTDLPSYATPPEEYARFIEAVLVAECRMTLYRVAWP